MAWSPAVKETEAARVASSHRRRRIRCPARPLGRIVITPAPVNYQWRCWSRSIPRVKRLA